MQGKNIIKTKENILNPFYAYVFAARENFLILTF